MPTEKKQSTVKKPLKFDAPEKPNLVRITLIWLVIMASVLAIYTLIVNAPQERPLTCESAGRSSLIGFGTCHED